MDDVVREFVVESRENLDRCDLDLVALEGEKTELDRTIIEAIKDPLTHIVRNSVDHGSEDPATRVAAGKQSQGKVRIRAFHEGGQVNIEIADDGAGIDRDVVKRKAVERGIVTPEQAARMSDREATSLIFLPGFSTAKQVTNISGRGVGMDVVKTNIEDRRQRRRAERKGPRHDAAHQDPADARDRPSTGRHQQRRQLRDSAGVPDRPLQVVAHAAADTFVGVVVDEILDIVQVPLRLQRAGARPPLLGTAVLQGRVTEAIDIDAVLRMAGLGQEPAAAGGNHRE